VEWKSWTTRPRYRLAGFEKKGGRKTSFAVMPQITQAFITVVDTYTAGDPMREGVLWTNLTRSEIAAGLASEGFKVSETVVDRLLEAFHMGQRKPRKAKAMQHHPNRDAQFRHIAKLKREFLKIGEPVISMDTKKREMLGDYVRPGRILSSAPLCGWDHDFPTHSQGVVIPHGLYDLALNKGYMHLGDSHDTSEFAADALIDWWRNYGSVRYSQSTGMLLLCDSGGSNGANRLVFKEQLQRVADATELMIQVAHYPPGCSKFNPIDHRLFPHVTRKLQGLFLNSVAMFRDLAKRVTTRTGLRVFARTLRGFYELGKRATVQSAEQLRIWYDRVLPKWNYVIVPKAFWDII
jgi:hypothetical protein